MRRSNLLPVLAATGLAMFAVQTQIVSAQTAAPSAADATADALKKAATGAAAKPAVPTAAAPADAAPKSAAQSAIAKTKAMLPWQKAKAASGDSAAPASADAPKTEAAAKSAVAKPAAVPTADAAAKPVAPATAALAAKPAVAAKADPAKPAKGASGEVMSGPMAATHAFFGAGTYAAPTPSKTAVRAGCTRLAHSSIDVGKENPIKFSREGIDNQIAALSKTKGWKATAKSDEKVICTEYVNLGLFGQEYTCRVETTVCPK